MLVWMSKKPPKEWIPEEGVAKDGFVETSHEAVLDKYYLKHKKLWTHGQNVEWQPKHEVPLLQPIDADTL